MLRRVDERVDRAPGECDRPKFGENKICLLILGIEWMANHTHFHFFFQFREMSWENNLCTSYIAVVLLQTSCSVRVCITCLLATPLSLLTDWRWFFYFFSYTGLSWFAAPPASSRFICGRSIDRRMASSLPFGVYCKPELWHSCMPLGIINCNCCFQLPD